MLLLLLLLLLLLPLLLQGMVFVAVGGMRGAVSLILAQSVLTMESATDEKHHWSRSPDGINAQEAHNFILAGDDDMDGRRKTERKVWMGARRYGWEYERHKWKRGYGWENGWKA